jgi:hypothetical protein
LSASAVVSAHESFEPVEPRRRRRRRRRRARSATPGDETLVSIDLFIPFEEIAGVSASEASDERSEAELRAVVERLESRAQSLHVERVLLKAHASRLREEFESVARELEVRRQELARWQAALTGREAALMQRELALDDRR